VGVEEAQGPVVVGYGRLHLTRQQPRHIEVIYPQLGGGCHHVEEGGHGGEGGEVGPARAVVGVQGSGVLLLADIPGGGGEGPAILEM